MKKKNIFRIYQTDSFWVYVQWDSSPFLKKYSSFFLHLESFQKEKWKLAYKISIKVGIESWHLLIPENGEMNRVSLWSHEPLACLIQSDHFETFGYSEIFPEDESIDSIHKMSLPSIESSWF